MRRNLVSAMSIALAATVLASVAHAQSSLGIGNAEVTAAPSGPFAGLFVEILAIQRGFFVELREALVAVRDGQGGALWLVGLSFAYGIFHAAGPGHGKAVISSYVLANEVALRRGIVLSFASALAQGLAAGLIVGIGWLVLRGTAVSMTDAAFSLELLSYLGIALVGAWLTLRKGSALLGKLPVARMFGSVSSGQATGLAFAAAGTFTHGAQARSPTALRASGAYGDEICDDAAGEACDCGRPHLPDAASMGKPGFTWRSGASAVLAIGMRPCSGAIVVLTFALLNGLYLSGALSVAAMALGTAITVSLLATAAVFAKDLALRLGRRSGRPALARAGLELAGALVLFSLGLGLFLAALPLA